MTTTTSHELTRRPAERGRGGRDHGRQAASDPPGAPRVPAYPDGRGGLRVWCPWCDRWHYHGPGYGHRAARCHQARSPYKVTGYLLTDPARLAARW